MAIITLAWTLSSLSVRGALVAFFIFALLTYWVYLKALPRPIPGIPYNEISSKRLLGDVPRLMALRKKGQTPRMLWGQMAVEHQSPVTQCFLEPFGRSIVVVSDFRESQYLMLKKAKSLGRGRLNNYVWGGLIPEHFIAMEEHDARFKDTKGLVKDLMTTSFLHDVSAPASYRKVLNFIDFWKLKADAADGCVFDAMKDIGTLTYDIIMAAAVGIKDCDSETYRQLQSFQETGPSEKKCVKDNHIVDFPEAKQSPLYHSIEAVATAAAIASTHPSPWLFHLINNQMPSMKKVLRTKRATLDSYIDQSVQRLAEEGQGFKPRAAVDYMVSRETASAKKEGRKPIYDSLRMNDGLFGYLIGAQDSTHSTLSFMAKHLGDKQHVQDELRRAIHEAYPEALAKSEQPALSDILKTKVHYLDAFIEEVLRISNPSLLTCKEALCDLEVLGYVVPKGTLMILTTSGPTFDKPGIAVSNEVRHDSYKSTKESLGDWGNSQYPPAEFRPERWLQKTEDGNDGSVFNKQAGPFLTFSGGTRACWGKRLAYLELKLVATMFIWNFKFEKLPSTLHDWDVVDDLFLKPKHCRVKLSRFHH